MRAADLAAAFGREMLPFKVDVRKLKELGLTESLRPGYRLSPRGRAVLEALGTAGARRSVDIGFATAVPCRKQRVSTLDLRVLTRARRAHRRSE